MPGKSTTKSPPSSSNSTRATRRRGSRATARSLPRTSLIPARQSIERKLAEFTWKELREAVSQRVVDVEISSTSQADLYEQFAPLRNGKVGIEFKWMSDPSVIYSDEPATEIATIDGREVFLLVGDKDQITQVQQEVQSTFPQTADSLRAGGVKRFSIAPESASASGATVTEQS